MAKGGCPPSKLSTASTAISSFADASRADFIGADVAMAEVAVDSAPRADTSLRAAVSATAA